MGVEWNRVRALFERALDVAPEEREALLAACGEESELRREVEALLAARERAGDLLAAPAAEVAPTPAPPRAGRLRIGSILDGKYRIDKKLGQGGMGAVYLATHLGTTRAVALKVIVPERTGDRDFLARFRVEAAAAGRLRHPNVVDVTDFGLARVETDEVAYLVMEYLDGFELSALLREERRLALDTAVDILEQTCLAIEEAHRLGIVHRDIKPQNIWLEPNQRGGYTVKVLDFGIAKLGELRGPSAPPSEGAPLDAGASTGEAHLATTLVGPRSGADTAMPDPVGAVTRPLATEPPTSLGVGPQTHTSELITRTFGYGERRPTDPAVPATTDPARAALTRAGTIMGSAHYMSPEQCLGEPVDARSDVYSLGVLAFELLAGEKPFDATEPLSLMYKHIQEPAPSLGARRRGIPASVDEIVRSAMEKDPAKRPASAISFARSLRARAEGPGTLFRRALILFLENFGVFLRVSLLALFPTFLLFVYGLVSNVVAILLSHGDPSDFTTSDLVSAIVSLGTTPVTWAASSGMSAILLAQLTRAPLRRLRFSAMWRALRGTLVKVIVGGVLYFVYPTVLFTFAAIVGGFAAILAYIPLEEDMEFFTESGVDPTEIGMAIVWYGIVTICALLSLVLAWLGLRACLRYALFPVVTVIEGAGPWTAFRRSRELVGRAPRLVAPIVATGFFITIGAPALVYIGFEGGGLGRGLGILDTVLSFATELIVTPVLGTAYALAYLRLREFGGESQEQVFAPDSAASALLHDR